MASVTVTISSASIDIFTNFIRFLPGTGNYISIGSSLSGDSNEIFLSHFSIARTFVPSTVFGLQFASDQDEISGSAGDVLSDTMESMGTIALVASDGEVLTITGIDDSTEPYNWNPTPSLTRAFANHVVGLSDRSLTVTFNDNAATEPAAPEAPTVTSPNKRQLVVDFDDPDNGGSPITQRDLRWQVAILGNINWTELNNQTFPYTIDNLNTATAYAVQVRARNTEGIGPWSPSRIQRTRPNSPPVISIDQSNSVVDGNSTFNLSVSITDDDDATHDITWDATPVVGSFDDNESRTPVYTVPGPINNSTQLITIEAHVIDPDGGRDDASVTLSVRANQAPEVTIHTTGTNVRSGGSLQLSATVNDPDHDNDDLTLLWTGLGSFNDDSIEDPIWTSPDVTDNQSVLLTLRAEDPLGRVTSRAITMMVSPGLMLTDWDDTGYGDPIVLAIMDVTVSGQDITMDPVTPSAGELVVGPDLTIDGVERHGNDQPGLIRLRKEGTGFFFTYFDNEGTPQYPDAKLFIVFREGMILRQTEFTIAATGGGFNNWDADEATTVGLINGLTTGDQILLAIAEPRTEVSGQGDPITSTGLLGEATGRDTAINEQGEGTPVTSTGQLGEATGRDIGITEVGQGTPVFGHGNLSEAAGRVAQITETGQGTAITASGVLGEAAGRTVAITETGQGTPITASGSLGEAAGRSIQVSATGQGTSITASARLSDAAGRSTQINETGRGTPITSQGSIGEATGRDIAVNEQGQGTPITGSGTLAEASGRASAVATPGEGTPITATGTLGEATASTEFVTRTGQGTPITSTGVLSDADGSRSVIAEMGQGTPITSSGSLGEASGRSIALGRTGQGTPITADGDISEAIGSRSVVSELGTGTPVTSSGVLGEATGRTLQIAETGQGTPITGTGEISEAMGNSIPVVLVPGQGTPITGSGSISEAFGNAAFIPRFKDGSASLIPLSYTPDITERMLGFVPTYYQDIDRMRDLYQSIAPELFALHEFVVTPELIGDNQIPPPEVSINWAGSNEEIIAEFQHFKENLMGWGFERFIHQFLILGANHNLETYSELYNTYFDQKDLIYMRNKLLFYSAITKAYNGENFREEINLIQDNVLRDFQTDYHNYNMRAELNVPDTSELYDVIIRRIRQVVPAHYNINNIRRHTPNLRVDIDQVTRELFDDESITLRAEVTGTAFGDADYSWTIMSGLGSLNVNTLTESPSESTIEYTAPTGQTGPTQVNVKVTVTKDLLTTEDMMEFTISNIPSQITVSIEVHEDDDVLLDQGESARLTAVVSPSGVDDLVYLWSIDSGDGTLSVNDTQMTSFIAPASISTESMSIVRVDVMIMGTQVTATRSITFTLEPPPIPPWENSYRFNTSTSWAWPFPENARVRMTVKAGDGGGGGGGGEGGSFLQAGSLVGGRIGQGGSGNTPSILDDGEDGDIAGSTLQRHVAPSGGGGEAGEVGGDTIVQYETNTITSSGGQGGNGGNGGRGQEFGVGSLTVSRDGGDGGDSLSGYISGGQTGGEAGGGGSSTRGGEDGDNGTRGYIGESSIQTLINVSFETQFNITVGLSGSGGEAGTGGQNQQPDVINSDAESGEDGSSGDDGYVLFEFLGLT